MNSKDGKYGHIVHELQSIYDEMGVLNQRIDTLEKEEKYWKSLMDTMEKEARKK